MSTAVQAIPRPQYSGFCAYSKHHDLCRRNPWCSCPCHTEPAGAVVNDADAVAAPAYAEKDAHEAAHLSVAGVPATAPLSLDALDLTGTVAALSRDVAAWLDSAQEVEALDALATVRQARQDLAQVEAVIEQRAARLMSGNVVEWPGGVAERRFGKDRREWNHDELTEVVTRRIALDAATDRASGETDDMLEALVRDAIGQYALTNRPAWRTTALKQLDVDPDEYCHAIPGRTTVAITQAGPQ
jgi:hypothetical protein